MMVTVQNVTKKAFYCYDSIVYTVKYSMTICEGVHVRVFNKKLKLFCFIQ